MTQIYFCLRKSCRLLHRIMITARQIYNGNTESAQKLFVVLTRAFNSSIF